jgi:hypothetical protein
MSHRRKPTLAHQRFGADRAVFEGLDLAARFERIAKFNMWGASRSEKAASSAVDRRAARYSVGLGGSSIAPIKSNCGE